MNSDTRSLNELKNRCYFIPQLIKQNNSIHITETWHDGTEWYRVYSDGWIEQGGRININTTLKNITLNKPFSNTNYTITGMGINGRTYFCLSPLSRRTALCQNIPKEEVRTVKSAKPSIYRTSPASVSGTLRILYPGAIFCCNGSV